MDTKTLGEKGEEIAAVYLKKKGYRIVERNRVVRGRRQLGEIDIVAQKDGAIVFVEVKAGSGTGPFRPEVRVTRQKILRLRRAAKAWLGRSGKLGVPARIDVVAVDFSADDPPRVRHFPHAITEDTL